MAGIQIRREDSWASMFAAPNESMDFDDPNYIRGGFGSQSRDACWVLHNTKICCKPRSLARPQSSGPENKNDQPVKQEEEPREAPPMEAIGPVQDNIGEGRHFVGDYFLDSKIAGGSFGIVYAGRSIRNELSAIKKMVKDGRNLGSIDQEVSLLMKYGSHPNVIGFHDVIHTKTSVYLVMERAKMNLCELIKYADAIEQPDWRQELMKGILSGLNHLHSNGVFHLDLKPENVLLTLQWERGNRTTPFPRLHCRDVRLGDLGLCSVAVEPGPLCLPKGCIVGSIGFMAPELVLGKGGDAGAADMWSLGCILLELTEQKLPGNWGRRWYVKHHLESFLGRKNNQGQPGTNISLYKDFLFNNMLVLAPSDRASPETLLEHAWLQNSNYSE